MGNVLNAPHRRDRFLVGFMLVRPYSVNNQSAHHDAKEGLIYESDNSLILKVGPHNTYPEHAHAADEGYHFLAGGISPIEDGVWQR